jgi:hypothetical protein
MLVTIVQPKDRLLLQLEICHQISSEDGVPRMRKELPYSRVDPESAKGKPVVT